MEFRLPLPDAPTPTLAGFSPKVRGTPETRGFLEKLMEKTSWKLKKLEKKTHSKSEKLEILKKNSTFLVCGRYVATVWPFRGR